MSERFIPYTDALAEQIQTQCVELYKKMRSIPVTDLGLSHHGEVYLLGSHLKRLFFSIETSARLLYHSITLTKKKVEDIVIMDYGAGVGSLYLLAKMIGCKKVIYNDILEHWKNNALLIAKAINVDVDEYLVGDIHQTLEYLADKKIECDLITSRNVIEHIYELEDFYKCIHQYQPNAIVFSSTTANFYNPAMNLQHVLLHKKVEKTYYKKRFDLIKERGNQLTEKEINYLAAHTRGYDDIHLNKAVDDFTAHKIHPAKRYYYTNTCDTAYGVWAENILPFGVHKKMIEAGNMQARFQPGFWDTHYTSNAKNRMTKCFNTFIRIFPKAGYMLAPFIYVIAVPKSMQ
jgi:hypothetical protein